ncbi:MAG: hypothetical protein ABIX01_19780 [Chitinophagaceae bacterium]
MLSINTADALKTHIETLEIKKKLKGNELKSKVQEHLENLKPANLIRSAWGHVANSPQIKETILDNGIGLAAGYVSKKILVGKSHSPIKKLIGALAQYGVANVVANHPDGIKKFGAMLFSMIFKRKKTDEDEEILDN